MTIMMKACY